MPDLLDEYYASKASNQRQNDEGGLWSSLVNTYDKFDQDWLPDWLTGSDDPRFQEGLRKVRELPVVGKPIAAFNEAASDITGGIVNSLVGSPVRAASTALTAVTGPAAVASKLGSALRPVGYAARGMDTANSARSVASTIKNVQEGNYGRAVGSAIGAGLSGVGAAVPIGPRVNRPLPPVARPTAIPETPIVPNQLRVTSELPPVQPPVSGQQVLPETIGGRPNPTQFSRTVIRPNPAGLLEEKATPLINTKGGGRRVGDEANELLERGAREFDVLGLPANSKNLNRYKTDTEFRSRVQRQAEKLGGSQRYESTDGTRYVQEAPVPSVKKRDVTITDVRAELVKRGVAEPSDQLVARVRRDPSLLDKMGMTSEEMIGSVMPPGQVKGLLPAKTTKLGEGELSQGSLFTKDELPEAKLAVIETKPDLPPEIRQAASQARQKFAESSLLSQIGKNLGMSTEEELARMGQVGSEISRLEKIRSTDTPILYNQYAAEAQKIIGDANPEVMSKVVDFIEGKLSNVPDEVQRIGTQLKSLFARTGQELEGAGLLEKGMRGEDYFPRRYEAGFFDDVPALEKRLRDAGYSESQIDRTLKYVRESGERKISAQFSRNEYDIPGYRKDKEVIFEHIADLAHRVTTAKLYGAKDIDDPLSPLSKLVNSSEDPDRARTIMKRILGRDASADGTEQGKKLAQAAQNYATASFLSQFTISNLGGTLPLAMRSSLNETIQGFKAAFKDVDPSMRFMDNVNHYQKIVGSIGQTYADSSLVNRLFGIEKAQNFMNRVSAGTGKAHAEALFEQLKANPSNKIAREQLEDLTLEPVDAVLKQESLNQKQIERAMVRMADITQGVNEGRKLPHEWNRTGVARIPQVFMRYNFQTTKTIKDAILQDPLKNVPKLLAVGTILGEFLGDTKEAISTAAEVGANNIIGDGKKDLLPTFAENIDLYGTGGKGGRFDFARKELAGLDKLTKLNLADNPVAVRAFANLQQAFALGIPFDILASMTTEAKPNPLDLMIIPSEATRAVGGVRTAIEEQSLQNVGREVIKRIPYIGRGIAREIPTIKQSGRERTVTSPGSSGGWR